MKRMFKKSMSILLAFTLLFGSFAFGFSDADWAELATGFAVKAEAKTLGDYTYQEGYYGMHILGVNKSISGDVVVPSHFEGRPVAYIGESVFENCTDIKSIILPDTVVLIQEEAFKGCTSLESIKLSSDLYEI